MVMDNVQEIEDIHGGDYRCNHCVKNCRNIPWFSLEYDRPSHLFTSQWSCRWPWMYAFYRLCWASYLLVWLILSGTTSALWFNSERNRIKWFLFGTHICFLLLTISAILRAVLATAYYVSSSTHLQGRRRMNVALKLSWALCNLTNGFSVAVGASYWVAVFTPESVLPVDINTHGVNVLYILLDAFISHSPIYASHVCQAVITPTVYCLFNLIYVVCGGTNGRDRPYIYRIMDWLNAPAMTAAIAVGLIMLSAIFHVALSGLAKLRQVAAERYGSDSVCCCHGTNAGGAGGESPGNSASYCLQPIRAES